MKTKSDFDINPNLAEFLLGTNISDLPRCTCDAAPRKFKDRGADTHSRQALSVRELAERWGCSEQQVRVLLRTDRLPFFRLGNRMTRISVQIIEEFERGQSTVLSPIDQNSLSFGAANSGRAAPATERMIVVSLDPRCDELSPISKPSNLRQ